MFIKYFLGHHKTDILRIMNEEDVSKHYSVNINFLELFTADADLGNSLLNRPDIVLTEFDSSLLLVQQQLLQENSELFVKQNIHTRVYGVPMCPELHKSLLPGNEDLDSFLQVSGTVVRITLPKMLEFQRQYICAKCKYKMVVQIDLEQRCIIVPPKICTNPEVCKSTVFITDEKMDLDTMGYCKDYQEIKIQEQLSKLGMGKVPNSVWVTVEDDLVDVCKPGDNVTVCGIVKRRWKPQYAGKELNVELFLKANHIQVNNDNTSLNLLAPDIIEQHENFWFKYRVNPLEGRDIILKSICPELYGLFIVKLALAVVLAGGSQMEESEDAITPRSQPHLLLVGDPGTGKSQLLRFASKIIRRSVLTTGIGSTSAGLTVTAVMEDGEWQLEGGALVMADGGICCIDEFNSMKKHDRASIHEAMEQQTISVAKAGVVCKLHTRCTVLAATNPKCGIDSTQPFGMNINIASPLLSRFDVVLHLKDKIDHEWDSLVADYVLDAKRFEACSKETSHIWNIERLQSYFILIRQLNPVLTPEASQILSSYYQAQRIIASRNKARTTVRLLDSLIRLSQGHARLMFHKEVQITDAIIAVILVEASLQEESSLLPLNDMNADFPESSTIFQNALNFIVLEKLELMHLLNGEEVDAGDGENDLSSKNTSSTLLSSGSEMDIHTVASDGESSSSTVNLMQQLIESPKVMESSHLPAISRNELKRRKSMINFNESEAFNCRSDFNINASTDDCTEHNSKTKKFNAVVNTKRKEDTQTSNAKLSDVTNNQTDLEFFEVSHLNKRNFDEDRKHNKHSDSEVPKLKSKLNNFRFKPRDITTDTSPEKGIDINEMMNMIPSVADEDFNVEELDFDDVSQHSE